jgi:hypothetical protein
VFLTSPAVVAGWQASLESTIVVVVDIYGVFPDHSDVLLDDMVLNRTDHGNFVIESSKRSSTPIIHHIIKRSLVQDGTTLKVVAPRTISESEIFHILTNPPGVVYATPYAQDVAMDIMNRFVGLYIQDNFTGDFSVQAVVERANEVVKAARESGGKARDRMVDIEKRLELLKSSLVELSRNVGGGVPLVDSSAASIGAEEDLRPLASRKKSVYVGGGAEAGSPFDDSTENDEIVALT